MNNGEVVFRRIRGRIIPIRQKASEFKALSKEKKKEAFKGAAIAASGVGTAFAGGYGFKRTMLAFLGKDTQSKNIIKNIDEAATKAGQLDLFNHGPQFAKSTAEADKLFKQSQRIAKFGSVIRYAAPLAGAGLIAYGANKFSKSTSKNRQRLKKISVYGAAGAIGTSAFFYGQFGKAGIKEAFVKHALPKIKDFIKATSL